MALVRAAAVSELPAAGLTQRLVAGRKILFVCGNGTVRAFEDRCAHLGLPLSEGRVDNGVLICPAHEWEYDVVTGVGVNPKTVCLKAFAVTIERDDVLVDIG
ncbi:MAG: Rieske 2Fe-2S domain-containing protein [Planctomycetaceae bacterium]|nr:Rieske 2Fe-2S domain-containing protein [Planctomycetaceae bacterium]